MKNTLEALAPDDKNGKKAGPAGGSKSPRKSPKKGRKHPNKTQSSLHMSVYTTKKTKVSAGPKRIGQGKTVLRPGIALFGN